jgi:hypothetical protein
MKPSAKLVSGFLLISLVVSVLSGCSLLPGASSPVAQSTPGTVTPHLDEKDRVEAVIPATGGSITLTLPSGLVYTLTIPDGALVYDQRISMVPITRIDGMLLSGGLIGGVQLEPDGLKFAAPATLTITVPKGYDPKKMVGIAYHGQGEGFHLDQSQGDGKTITLTFLSFSGHGAASGTSSDVANQSTQPTQSSADALDQQAAAQEFIEFSGPGCFGGDDAACQPLINDISADWTGKVKPDLVSATTDDTMVEIASGELFEWERMVEFTGLDRVVTVNGQILSNFPQNISTGYGLLITADQNAFKSAFNRCIQNQDIIEAEKMFYRLNLIAKLAGTGKSPNGDGGYNLQNKFNKLEQCLRYRLSFDSVMTQKWGDSMTIKIHLKGSVILHALQDDFFFYSGSGGELTYEAFSVEYSGASAALGQDCTVEITNSGGKLKAAAMLKDINVDIGYNAGPADFTPHPLDPMVVLSPVSTTRLPQWKCSESTSMLTVNVGPDIPIWQNGFYKLHEDAMQDFNVGAVTIVSGYMFQNFTIGDGEFHIGTLKKHTTVTNPNYTYEEDLTLDIDAAPGQDK